jgi:hypothetical protein
LRHRAGLLGPAAGGRTGGAAVFAGACLCRACVGRAGLLATAGTGSTLVSSFNSMASINNNVYGMTGYFKPQPFTLLSAYFISSSGNGIQLGNKIYNTSIYGSTGDGIDKTNPLLKDEYEI